jgi:hypothetical protein
MKIDVRTRDCCYIELNDYVYYIDDSTGEQIVHKWHKDSVDSYERMSKIDRQVKRAIQRGYLEEE